MPRPLWFAATAAVALVALALNFASADPEVGPPPGPPPHDGPGHGHRPPPDPLRRALDTDGDHELSSEEIANAASSLKSLDKNGDGKLDREELRPPMPPHMRGRGPDGDRRGPPPGEGREGRESREGREGRRGPSPDDRGEFRGPPRSESGRPEMPGPEMFVERLMEFDNDGDGKLDKSELMVAAETMAQRRREFMEKMGRWMGERRRP